MNSQNDPQDQKNLIIAIVLSFAVFLGWQYFFAAPQLREEQAKQQYTKELEAQRAGKSDGVPGVGPGTNTVAATSAPETPGAPPKAAVSRDEALKASPRIAVRTPSLAGSIALKGARVDDLMLLKYRETADPNSANVTLLSPAGTEHPYFAAYGWLAQTGSAAKVPDDQTLWSVESGDALTPETPITLTYDNGAGLVFRRTFSIDKDYMLKVVNEVENKTTADVSLMPYARVHRVGVPKHAAIYILHEGLIGVSGEEGLQEITYADATESKNKKTFENVTGGWLGITDKYWAAALIPDQKEPYNATYSPYPSAGPEQPDAFQVDYLRGAVVIPPNARKGVESHLFAGAKQATLIDTYGADLDILHFDRLVDWGWFYFITKPLFYLMELINGVVKNFGVTILILTVIVKAGFFPLANKQYTSMARMKKLQPEMQRIKDLYKDDPQRQQKETFELYRKEKINPVAGCWPVLLQIPVFFALYKVLYVTIDMRHAPFFGWIQDLSAPDPTSIFNLFGLLPFGVPEFLHIGVWPLLMGITMWVQMQLNPPQPDPIQQQIFSWMPVMFTFLLATFPAGLVIYWTWSNVLSIAQQWVINKRNGAEIHLMQNVKRTFGPVLKLVGIGRAESDSKPK